MTQDDPDREPLQVKFSLPQLLGGALAAATAALIGSQLGVAGTIFGASVASVVGGVAGTLYSAGLDRTHRRVSDAIKRGYDRVVEEDEEPTRTQPASSATAEFPAVQAGAAAAKPSGRPSDPGVKTTGGRPVPAPPGGGRPPSRRRKVLVGMGLSVAAIFLVAMGVITAIELGIGRSLDGSATTTIGGHGRPVPSASVTAKPKPTPSASESSSQATPETPSAPPASSPAPSPSDSPAPTDPIPELTAQPAPSFADPTPSATGS